MGGSVLYYASAIQCSVENKLIHTSARVVALSAVECQILYYDNRNPIILLFDGAIACAMIVLSFDHGTGVQMNTLAKPVGSPRRSNARVRLSMHQHQADNSEGLERMETAAANLKRILRDLEAFEHKPKVEEVSTDGTWRSGEESFPQIQTE